jgi:hypothetical protein
MNLSAADAHNLLIGVIGGAALLVLAAAWRVIRVAGWIGLVRLNRSIARYSLEVLRKAGDDRMVILALIIRQNVLTMTLFAVIMPGYILGFTLRYFIRVPKTADPTLLIPAGILFSSFFGLIIYNFYKTELLSFAMIDRGRLVAELQAIAGLSKPEADLPTANGN